jgi:hypothetical protein
MIEQRVEELLLYIRLIRQIVRRNREKVHLTAHSDSPHRRNGSTVACPKRLQYLVAACCGTPAPLRTGLQRGSH